MAIYRLERKSISRGNNHNLVAAIAYRAGLKLTDNNKLNDDARTHDYTKKTDVAHSEILLPDELSKNMNDAGLTLNLEEIANLVEKGETTLRGKMKLGAKLANEYVLAGSHELSLEENIKAFQEFAKQQSEEQGVIAMVFVHDPKHGNDMSAEKESGDNDNSPKKKDERNIHAHIVLLSRQVELKNGELTLGRKCDSDASNDERMRPVVPKHLVGKIDPATEKIIHQGRGLCSNSEWLKGVRKSWADIQNKSLERHNLSLVTHKSYKNLGVKFKPGKHLGKNANHLENMGIKTEIGNYNDAINSYNRQHSEYATSRLTDIAEQRISDSEQRIGYHEQQADRADRIIASRDRTARPNPFDEQYRTSVNIRKQRAAELDERASTFDRETEYYRYEFEIATEQLIDDVTQEFFTRSDEKFDARQLKVICDFAQKNNLTLEQSKDYRDYLRKSKEFFKGMSLSDNEQIIKLLRDPQSELLEHEKTNNGIGFSDSALSSPQPRATDSAFNTESPTRRFRP